MNRTLTTLSLAALLGLAPSLGSDAAGLLGLDTLSQELRGVGAAEAAFIRRGKLKKRPTIGYKVVVITEWDESDDTDTAIDSVDVDLSVDGGSAPTVTTQYRLKNKKHFKGLITQYPATYSITINVDNGDGTSTAVSAPVEGLEPTVVGSETTVVTDAQGIKAHLRVLSLDGDLKVQVFNEDRDWDPSIVSDVSVAGVDIPYVRTTQRWRANVDEASLPEGFGDGSGYTIAVTAKDATGAVLDTSSATQVLGEDPVGPGINKVRLAQTNSGDLKVVTTSNGFDGGSSALQVMVTDAQGEVVLSSLDDMSASVSRLYGTDTMTFEDPASAVDEPYGVVIAAFDESGNLVGSTDTEIVVQGLSGTGAESDGWDGVPIVMTIDGSEVAGRVVSGQRDATNFVLAVALASDKAARVDVEITDLIGNPSIPESVSLETEDEARRWVSKSSGVTVVDGETLDVTVNLLDEEDQVVGSVSGSVNGLPQNAYKQNPNYSNGGWVRNWQYGM